MAGRGTFGIGADPVVVIDGGDQALHSGAPVEVADDESIPPGERAKIRE